MPWPTCSSATSTRPGRLPFSVPTSEDHLPFFDRTATAITYDKWFGQRLLDRDGHAAAFPLGFGLSYTEFALSDLSVDDLVGDSFGSRGDRDECRPSRRAPRRAAVRAPRGRATTFPIGCCSGSHRSCWSQALRPAWRWKGRRARSSAGPAKASRRPPPPSSIEASSFAGDPQAVTAPVTFRLS